MAMNQTLPELKYNGALRTFGHSAYLPDRSTMSVYDVKSYSTAGFGSALKDVKGPSGDSSLPLAKAIVAAGKDLKSTHDVDARSFIQGISEKKSLFGNIYLIII